MIADPKHFRIAAGKMPARRQPMSGYHLGYIGFTHCPGPLSDGICYFERWARLSDIAVSHALVVVSNTECVEAHWPGVQRAPLAKYLEDRRAVTVFRRPRGLTPDLANRIAMAAEKRIGSRYNIGLIGAQLMANTFVGHYLNRWFGGRPDAWMSRRLNRRNEFICSELAAFALNEQPEFHRKGILRRPLDTISPQELFEDQVIFEPREAVEKSGNRETPLAGVPPRKAKT